MQLTLGPNLFFWPRKQIEDFYQQMASQPLAAIYMGETVCSKRRELNLDAWLGLAKETQAASKAEIIVSGLTLLEARSEIGSLKRLCNNGDFKVEANDMAAVEFLSQNNLPFVGGSALNIYNAHALAEFIEAGLFRWVPPVEASGKLIASILQQLDELGIKRPEVEVFAYGHLPLAFSARCFTARAENRPKDECEFCCINYPEGLPLLSQEGQEVFTINGIQTMSGEVQNLLGDFNSLKEKGANFARLSPRAEGMAEVIGSWHQVIQGEQPPLAISGCNGYWHGEPGMVTLEEAGLC